MSIPVHSDGGPIGDVNPSRPVHNRAGLVRTPLCLANPPGIRENETWFRMTYSHSAREPPIDGFPGSLQRWPLQDLATMRTSDVRCPPSNQHHFRSPQYPLGPQSPARLLSVTSLLRISPTETNVYS